MGVDAVSDLARIAELEAELEDARDDTWARRVYADALEVRLAAADDLADAIETWMRSGPPPDHRWKRLGWTLARYRNLAAKDGSSK
jgi:hypothetical protein